MKLFWKMFLSIISIITIIFSIFGGWLLHASFNAALSREKNRVISENQMFLYSLETSLGMLPENYINKNEKIEDIINSIKQSIGQNQYSVGMYDKDEKAVYRDNGMENFITPDNKKEGAYAYAIINKNGAHYMEIMSHLKIDDSTYYINMVRDIQHIYTDREEMYNQYKIILVISLFISGILSYILSVKITQPLVLLSNTAQKMAEGNYDIRAEMKATGETGMLVQNFNLMAEKLEENIAELEDAARKQEDFTSSFAHELKTPLTSIVGYSDMLRSMQLSEKEVNEYSNYIFIQGKRLEKLSLKLMEMISLDKQNFEFVKINAKKLCVSIKNSVIPALHEKKIKFILGVEEDYIWGDVDLLVSLFINLIDNARKAVSENGIIILSGRNTKEGYMISVKDNGCGMEKSEIRKITEAFYMIDKSRARKEGGAGIGMSLCQKIVTIHKAKWMIKSKPGKGTVIGILFSKLDN